MAPDLSQRVKEAPIRRRVEQPAAQTQQRESFNRSIDTDDDEANRSNCCENVSDKLSELLPDAHTQLHSLVAFGLHLLLLMSGDHTFRIREPTDVE